MSTTSPPIGFNFDDVIIQCVRVSENTDVLAGSPILLDDTVLSPSVNSGLNTLTIDKGNLDLIACKHLTLDRASVGPVGVLLDDDLQATRIAAMAQNTFVPVRVMLRGVTTITLGSTADMSFSYTNSSGRPSSHAPGTVAVGDPIDVGYISDASAKGKWEKAWKPDPPLAKGRGKVMALEAGSPGDSIRVYVDVYKNAVGHRGT
jgi:hypothetical protein|tara:strand:- start:37 stop:648 length:612 start_codon:yes stop_codon:yes gene_type:complete